MLDKDFIYYIIAVIIFIIVAVFMNKYNIEQAELYCANNGGEFYKSMDIGDSFCKLPKK